MDDQQLNMRLKGLEDLFEARHEENKQTIRLVVALALIALILMTSWNLVMSNTIKDQHARMEATLERIHGATLIQTVVNITPEADKIKLREVILAGLDRYTESQIRQKLGWSRTEPIQRKGPTD